MTWASGLWRRVVPAVLVLALLIVSVLVALRVARPADGQLSASIPPPPDGYFRLLPVGSYASLPGDAAAAVRVRRSSWEPRRANARYNHTVPSHVRLQPENVADHAYDPRWNGYILRRVTGHFTGTTDEIFQWAAAKWGLPDNVLRTIAYMESDWHQRNYGDYVHDRAKCPPGYRHLPAGCVAVTKAGCGGCVSTATGPAASTGPATCGAVSGPGTRATGTTARPTATVVRVTACARSTGSGSVPGCAPASERGWPARRKPARSNARARRSAARSRVQAG